MSFFLYAVILTTAIGTIYFGVTSILEKEAREAFAEIIKRKIKNTECKISH